MIARESEGAPAPEGRSASRERLLVVDDSAETCELVQRHLSPEGYAVLVAHSVPEAVRILKQTPVDLVLTDMKMPRASGLDLIRHVRENSRDTSVMMITGYASIEGAVTAVKLGAEEYLAKPFTKEELLAAVGRVVAAGRARRAAYAEALPDSVYGLVGDSEAMRKIREAIGEAAGRTEPVLLLGEDGSGRAAVARAIHYAGPRSVGLFLEVNCAGLPVSRVAPDLLKMSEAATGGTLFLRRIETIQTSLQARFLGTWADRDLRVIASTHRPDPSADDPDTFPDRLQEGTSALTIEIPPLREHPEDILPLARHFAARLSRRLGRALPAFSERALGLLREYEWPGNVGELEGAIHRLLTTSKRELIEAPDLPSLMRFSALSNAGLNRSLAEVELEYIRNVLAGTGRNKTKAAEILGIDRKTLREKLKAGGDEAD